MAHDVVNVGADRRQQVEAAQVGRSVRERDVQRVAVDHQRRLAEAELAELRLQRLGLALLNVEIVEDDDLAVLGLRRKRHLQA